MAYAHKLVQRQGQFYIWSRGEELLTDKFPELVPIALCLPAGTVLDGELIGWQHQQPLPFQLLQTRITRKTVTKKQLQECPVVVLVYDLLEHNGHPIFEGIAQNTEVMRYHSLCLDLGEQSPLEAIAHAQDDQVLMGLAHKTWPLIGLQFHPESIGTIEGQQMIHNWAKLKW